MSEHIGVGNSSENTVITGDSEVSKVFIITYLLLSATLIFAALTVLISMTHSEWVHRDRILHPARGHDRQRGHSDNGPVVGHQCGVCVVCLHVDSFSD